MTLAWWMAGACFKADSSANETTVNNSSTSETSCIGSPMAEPYCSHIY